MRAYKNMRQFGWNMLVPAGRFEWLHDDETLSEVSVLDSDAELEFERRVTYMGTADDVQLLANSSGIYWLCLVDEVPPMTCSELLHDFPGVIWVQSTNSLAPASAVMHCGYIPYRSGIQSMARLGQGSDDFWKTIARLKDHFDPQGVLAPGRYNPSNFKNPGDFR